MAMILFSCSDKLKFNWESLNKMSNRDKKTLAHHYAMAYFIVNQIEITDAMFKDIETKLNVFYSKVDEAKKQASSGD